MPLHTTLSHGFNSPLYLDYPDAQLIDRIYHSGVILPGPHWQAMSYKGSHLTLTYRIRVICSPYYYESCAKFCRARDDRFGHYKCDGNGDKACLEGWMGSNCETGKSIEIIGVFLHS